MEENTNMSEATPMDSAPTEMPMDKPMTQSDTSSAMPTTPAKEEEKKDKSKMMIVIAVILLIVCIVCCGLLFVFKDAFKLTPTDNTNGTPTPTSTATATPTPTEEVKESNRPTTSKAADFETYDKNGIVIEYPSKWEEIAGTSAALIFQVASPLSSATDAFRENLNVTTEDLSKEENITLEEYYDLSVYNLKLEYPDLVIVSETDTVLAGQDAMQIIYTIEANGSTITQDVKIMQIIAIVGEDAYVITYSATTAAFSTFTNEVNYMINSFKVNQDYL